MNRNSSFETYCRLVEHDVEALFSDKKTRRRYDNLSKEERDALFDLKTDRTIIIKPADKRGAIVIQNVNDYVRECERQRSDLDFYEKLSEEPTQIFKKQIYADLDSMLQSGEINKREFEYLKIKNPIISTFYTLPNIHKCLESPPGRPISGTGSLISSISTFVDFFKTIL